MSFGAAPLLLSVLAAGAAAKPGSAAKAAPAAAKPAAPKAGSAAPSKPGSAPPKPGSAAPAKPGAETPKPGSAAPAKPGAAAGKAGEAAGKGGAPAADARRRAVALLPVVGVEVGPELLAAIDTALFNEFSELESTQGLDVMATGDVTSALVQAGIAVEACEQAEDDAGCRAQAGRAIKADWVLTSRVVPVAGILNVSLELVDAGEGVEMRRVADAIADDPQARASDLHRLVVQLISPETYVGSLMIACDLPGAAVFIDDQFVGETPLAGALPSLRAGPHILRVAKTGFADFHRFVDVVYKRSSTLRVDLENNTIAGQFVEVESTTGVGLLWVVSEPDGVEIRADGEPLATTKLAEELKVAAGAHRLSFRLEGLEPVSTNVEIQPGRRTELAVVLQGDALVVGTPRTVVATAPRLGLDEAKRSLGATAATDGPAAAAAVDTGPGWKLWVGLAAAGLGAASFGTMAFFGTQIQAANDDVGRLERALLEPDLTLEQYVHLEDQMREVNGRGRRAVMMQWIALGVGTGLCAAGATLILWDLLSGGEAPEVAVGAGPGALVLRGTF